MRISSKTFRVSWMLMLSKEANGEFCYGKSDPDNPCRGCILKCNNGYIDTTSEIKTYLKRVKRVTH